MASFERVGRLAPGLLRSDEQAPMTIDPDSERSYDVAVDMAALRWESATPLFARYSVSLSGGPDQVWLDCFERASLDSAEFSRFRLDSRTMTVSFVSKMSAGPAEVASILRRLELLVSFVNDRARSAAADGPGGTQNRSAMGPGETPS